MSYTFPLPRPLPVLLAETEREIIRDALKKAKNNATHAAYLLKIKRSTLAMKRKKYRMPMCEPTRKGKRRGW